MKEKEREKVIRPGLLVSLKTSVRGGVSYERIDLATGEVVAEGETVDRWETRRTIRSAEEYKRATKARSAARREIERCCIQTSFGLLCPQDREQELDQAEARVRETVDSHNRDARSTCIEVLLIRGRVAATDEQAARAIASEVRDLVDRMNSAIRSGDPEQIRAAASRAAQASDMLTAEKGAVVTLAVQAARRAARLITKRVSKGGEALATVIAEIDRRPIQTARMSLLDLDAPAAASEPVDDGVMPGVSVQRFADLDTGGDTDARSPAGPAAGRTLDLDLGTDAEVG